MRPQELLFNKALQARPLLSFRSLPRVLSATLDVFLSGRRVPKPLMSTNRVKPVLIKPLLEEKIKTKPKPRLHCCVRRYRRASAAVKVRSERVRKEYKDWRANLQQWMSHTRIKKQRRKLRFCTRRRLERGLATMSVSAFAWLCYFYSCILTCM